MAQPVGSRSRQCINSFAETSQAVARGGASSYIAAVLLTSDGFNINPLHGALFGVIATLVNRITAPIFKIMHRRLPNNCIKDFALFWLRIITIFTISFSVCTLFGFPLSLDLAGTVFLYWLFSAYIFNYM